MRRFWRGTVRVLYWAGLVFWYALIMPLFWLLYAMVWMVRVIFRVIFY